MRSLPLISGCDRPRPSHPATRAHRRLRDRRRGLRGVDRRRSALRWAGPAVQCLPVRGPGLSRFGLYGRYDSFSLDGSHVLRLASRLIVEALRPGIRPIPRMPVPLPTSIK